MAENKVSVELTIEQQEALKNVDAVMRKFDQLESAAVKAGKKTGGALKDAFKIESLKDLEAAFNLLTVGPGKVLNGIKAVSGAVFDLLANAGDIKAISEQFELLTRNAGLSAEVIGNDVVKAMGGIADNEDILQAASQALVGLGSNGARLGEIFELARKAATVMGGDTIERFHQISTAIETGNHRSLRQLGIVVDLDKAYKKYGDSIGFSVDKLTVSEKQQAGLNAVLEKGQSAYAGVDVNARELEKSSKKLSVALGELYDTASLVFNKALGKDAKASTGTLTSILQDTDRVFRNMFLGEDTKLEQLEKLQRKLAAAEQDRLERLGRGDLSASEEQHSVILTSNIARLEKLIALDEKRNRSAGATSSNPLAGILPGNASAADGSTIAAELALASGSPKKKSQDEIDAENARNQERLAAEASFQADMTAIKANAENDRAMMQFEIDAGFFGNQAAALDKAYEFEQAKLKIVHDAELKKAAAITDRTKRDQETDKANLKFKTASEKLKTQNERDQQKTREQNVKDSLGTISTLTSSSNKTLFAIGKASSLAQATIDGIAAVQKAWNTPPPFNIPLTALVAAATAANVAKIASMQPPRFARGGIVPGNSITGDRVSALVNSGEMVLNRNQQSELFSIANGGGTNGGNIAQLISAIEGRPVIVKVDGREIARSVRDQKEAGFSS